MTGWWAEFDYCASAITTSIENGAPAGVPFVAVTVSTNVARPSEST